MQHPCQQERQQWDKEGQQRQQEGAHQQPERLWQQQGNGPFEEDTTLANQEAYMGAFPGAQGTKSENLVTRGKDQRKTHSNMDTKWQKVAQTSRVITFK
jgi:hypothetical protein